MAEFEQTMKDWRRMCKAQDDTTCEACSSCPMGDDGKSCMAVYEDKFETVDFAHIEQTVTEWAAEHPEPVYPTWYEYLISESVLVPRSNYTTYDLNALLLAQLKNTPIHADIAQKLGIEPKEDA